MTCQSKLFSFSLEAGEAFVREVLQGVWSHTPRDHQIEAVVKLLDGIDVLAILPTGAGKTAISMMFMLVLNYMKSNPGCSLPHCRWFPEEPIIVVVYPTNCLEEEQVCTYKFMDELILWTENCVPRPLRLERQDLRPWLSMPRHPNAQTCGRGQARVGHGYSSCHPNN